MKIFLCHNYYQQPGGEDRVFAAEGEVLERQGHQVIRFTRHNNAISHMHPLIVAGRTIWNHSTYRALRAVIRRERPAVMHCTNTFPLISSAAYDAARAEGVAVVQSLHNYRLFCLNAQFLRHYRVCEDCIGKVVLWPGVRYACYRVSRSVSLVVAGMLGLHRALRTSTRKVHRYLTPSTFARQKLCQGGRTGLLCEPGDPEDLVSKLKLLLADRPKLTHMRLVARKAYETKFTAETNYRLLMTNYLSAIKTQQRQ